MGPCWCPCLVYLGTIPKTQTQRDTRKSRTCFHVAPDWSLHACSRTRGPPCSISGGTFPTNGPVRSRPSSGAKPGPSRQRLGTRQRRTASPYRPPASAPKHVSSAEGPSPVRASQAMWQDFFYPGGWWIRRLFPAGAIPHAGKGWERCPDEKWQLRPLKLGLNLTLGSKQLSNFWEAKRDVLQHMQPGRLTGNGISQLAPSAAQLDSRAPTPLGFARSAQLWLLPPALGPGFVISRYKFLLGLGGFWSAA